MKLSNIVTIGAVSGIALLQGTAAMEEMDAECTLCIAAPFMTLLATVTPETVCPAYDDVNAKLLSCPCTPEDVSSLVNTPIGDLDLSIEAPEGMMLPNTTTIFQVVSSKVVGCANRLYSGSATVEGICEEACYEPIVEPLLELIELDEVSTNCTDVGMYATQALPCAGVCPLASLTDDEGNGVSEIYEKLVQLTVGCPVEVQVDVDNLGKAIVKPDNKAPVDTPSPSLQATSAPSDVSAASVDQVSTGLVAVALVVVASLFR